MQYPKREIDNDFPPQTPDTAPSALLEQALEQLVETTPPLELYTAANRQLGGLFSGYTGLAYLFLRLSEILPDLEISGHGARSWAKKYLDGKREVLVLDKGNCGIGSEKLSYEAVKACFSQDMSDVHQFLSNIPELTGPYQEEEGTKFPSEWVNGRAGTLYMLRMIRHFVPASASYLQEPIRSLSQMILEANDDGKGNWQWRGTRYYGAAHGDIGIITQLVLTTPSLAPQLAPRLEELLDAQMEDGNWPIAPGSLKKHPPSAMTVQWCHGAPGFASSLPFLRPHFPELQERIDSAIEKAQELVYRRGLLRKEPSMCHGIFGNGLYLPRGSKRDHFLALATPQSMSRMKLEDAELFEPSAYGKSSAVLLNYLPSAAWAWAVYDQDLPPMIMYTDV